MNRESIKFYAGVKTGNAVYFWLWADQLPPTNVDTRPELFKMAELPSKGEGIRPAMAAELTRLCKKAAERANESAEEKDHYFLPPTAEVYHTLRRSFLEASFPRCVKLNESAATEECQDRPLYTKAQAAANIRRALLSLDDNDIVAAAFIDAAAHGAPPGGNVESEGIAKTFEAMKGGGKKATARKQAMALCREIEEAKVGNNTPIKIWEKQHYGGRETEWEATSVNDALTKIDSENNRRGDGSPVCEIYTQTGLRQVFGGRGEIETAEDAIKIIGCSPEDAKKIEAFLAAPENEFYAVQDDVTVGEGQWDIIHKADIDNFRWECLVDNVAFDNSQSKIEAA